MDASLGLPAPWIRLADGGPVPEHRSPAQLSEVVARGDRAAFDELHRRLQAGLSRLFLRRTGGRADVAEDLAQRTWMACWRAVSEGKYDPARAAFSTFAYAVGSKVWLEYLRGADARARGSGELLAEPAAPGVPGDELRQAELIDAVRECLRPGSPDLSEDERWLVRAMCAGATDRELAKRLGVAPSTVNTRKQAALGKLRRALARRGHREGTGERPAAEPEQPGGQAGPQAARGRHERP